MSKINQRRNFSTDLTSHPLDKFKDLFEATPVALVEGVWGTTFEVINANSSASELFLADSSEQFASGFNALLSKVPSKILLELLSARIKGDLFEAEFRLPTFRRSFIYVFMRLNYMPALKGGHQHVLLAFHDITSRKRQETFLKKLSQIDGLTKVLNQRTILQRIDVELQRAKRYQLDLACIIIDLDNFKQVNDTFGHLWGDKCIKHAVDVLKESLRKTDIIGRYGGDEFLVLLPETNYEQSIVPVKRFLKAYDASSKIKCKGKVIKTSFSVGISGFPLTGIETSQDLIKTSDQALYRSKTSGGNCYHLHLKQS